MTAMGRAKTQLSALFPIDPKLAWSRVVADRLLLAQLVLVLSAQTNEVGFRSFLMTSCSGHRLLRAPYVDNLSARAVPKAAPKSVGLTTLVAIFGCQGVWL
jgi:hypothetical protein